MSDAADVLRWHDWYREKCTVSQPAPAEMTDREMLDFMDEYVETVQKIPATSSSHRRFVVIVDGMKTIQAVSLREAVCLAKAHFDETF